MKKIVLLAFALSLFFACSEDNNDNDDNEDFTYVNGTYKASEAEFAHGYKAYMLLTIENDEIASIEFDYIDENGNKKSEASADAYPMDPHPSLWLPEYESSLKSANILSFSEVDVITGATHSCETANLMMKTLLNAAKTGDTSEKIIPEE